MVSELRAVITDVVCCMDVSVIQHTSISRFQVVAERLVGLSD